MPVYFHSEDTDFRLDKKRLYKTWIRDIVNQHKKTTGNLNVIFCSNTYLLEINRKYLNHNYFTDVITFDYSLSDRVEGDVFVSIDQVKINCQALKVGFIEELCRVIIHGVLHLLGYMDDSGKKRETMRELEDSAMLVLRGLENGKDV